VPTIRVLVVDDHTLIRQGIVGLLSSQPDIEVVGQAGSGQEAIAAAADLSPDVVLMDVSMPPGMSGLDATREIRSRQPGVQVLILTIHDREDYLYQALRAGATGYVLKGADVQDLLAAVRSAQRGEVYLYPSVTKALVADFLRRSAGGDDPVADSLSDRERQILTLIAQGRTTAEIAAELFLSPHTVQSHRDHIMTKLDLHSKAALIKYAISKGLIEL
jgi:two-component system, NarL family, response regulator NreC